MMCCILTSVVVEVLWKFYEHKWKDSVILCVVLLVEVTSLSPASGNCITRSVVFIFSII